MALKRHDVIIAIIAVFVAWICAITWAPSLRWVGYAFASGLLLPCICFLALILLTSRGSGYLKERTLHRPNGPAILTTTIWKKEVRALQARQAYRRQSLYPQSTLVSTALDDLLDLVLRDFVESWYSNISKNPAFTNEVDKTVRFALASIRDRVLEADLVDTVTTRVVPILTSHFRDFYNAERAVRGKNLNRNVTESEELDLVIAGKYNDGKLHQAASLAYSSTQAIQQEYLRTITGKLMPKLLPESFIGSHVVGCLTKEIVACAVLSPLMQILSDPDTWNQLMEAYGRGMLQDRSTVRKLRAALDEHASLPPRSKRAMQFPRLASGDHERRFEKFIRHIRKVNNLSDARRFRSEVSSQLKKDALKEGQDPIYLRRLDISKRFLDQKVNQLAAGDREGSVLQVDPGNGSNSTSKLENASLVDILRDPSGLFYFMEYMDRLSLTPMVQFWLVVDGFRNPLEDDFAEDGEIPATLPSWTEADRTDLAQINEAYLSEPKLRVPESSREPVRCFLKAGIDATPVQFYVARRAILKAQTSILESMQEKYFLSFKKCDLFYKCLTSQEATSQTPAPMDSPLLLDTPSLKPALPSRSKTAQEPVTKPSPGSRISTHIVPKRSDLFRPSTLSSTDLPSPNRQPEETEAVAGGSFDGDAKAQPFDDDDLDSEVMNGSIYSIDSQFAHNVPDKKVVQAMEAALNDIMDDKPNADDLRNSLFGDQDVLSPLGDEIKEYISSDNSVDLRRADLFGREVEKPSISSLGLVNTSSRIGVFTDDDLFSDEEKFMSDEHDDPEDDNCDQTFEEVRAAAPGDLGLAEAIAALALDINRLAAQSSVIETLTRKAELTNNMSELRILRKSRASLLREIRRKELQREQYMVQESDNGLYGRSTIDIRSVVVGKDADGSEFAMYVIEVQRKAGEQMPAATWTISRRYSEFHELNQRLRIKYGTVRSLDFPRRRMVMKFQNDFLQKRRNALEKYLKRLLLLPEICRSRELRAFLSQNTAKPLDNDSCDKDNKKDMMTRLYNSVTDGMEDILGNIPVLDQLSVAGQNLLNAATSQVMAMPVTISDDPAAASEVEAELNAFEDRELEPFVKPICDIFLEVFELNRGNNWLRGRAVVVVLHQLLGGTIERKVRDNVRGLVQDAAIVRYIGLLKNTMWLNGEINRDRKPRTIGEKSKSRNEASLMLATLVPDLAGNVVGRINAQAASRRIFATFNNPRLNTHLVFTLLDEMIDVVFGAA